MLKEVSDSTFLKKKKVLYYFHMINISLDAFWRIKETFECTYVLKESHYRAFFFSQSKDS